MRIQKIGRLTSICGGVAYTLCVCILLVLSVVTSAVIPLVGGTESQAAKYISYLVSPVAIAITVAVMYAYCGVPAKKLLPVRTKPRYIFIGLALIFGLMFSLGMLNEAFVSLIESWGYVRRPSTLPDFTGWNILPALLVIAVLPAICEELLFRAVILNNVAEDGGELPAVLLVGLCFSLYHGSVEQTIYQFICGCAFALLAIRSRSVTPTVIIHFLNNALIIIISACGGYDPSGALALPFGWQVAIGVLSAVPLVVALALLIFEKTPLKKGKKGAVTSFFIGAGIGIVVMAVQWVAGLL